MSVIDIIQSTGDLDDSHRLRRTWLDHRVGASSPSDPAETVGMHASESGGGHPVSSSSQRPPAIRRGPTTMASALDDDHQYLASSSPAPPLPRSVSAPPPSTPAPQRPFRAFLNLFWGRPGSPSTQYCTSTPTSPPALPHAPSCDVVDPPLGQTTPGTHGGRGANGGSSASPSSSPVSSPERVMSILPSPPDLLTAGAGVVRSRSSSEAAAVLSASPRLERTTTSERERGDPDELGAVVFLAAAGPCG